MTGRLLALAASIGCTVLAAADVLKSLAGNGRPDSLDEHFATVPRDEPTPLLDAALANLRATLADWHDEVWALADVELAELIERGER